MKTLYLENNETTKLMLFPDNQPHVNLSGIAEGDEVRVVCSLTDSIHVLWLLELSNALKHLFAVKKELVIRYLLGARSDRVMNPGDSADLEVIASLINSCEFEKVKLLDVHSEVALSLINRSVNISNRPLVEEYAQAEAVLICPDAGAEKKVPKYFEWNPKLKEVVYCTKHRDLSNGKVFLKVLEPERCKGRNCVIIDDLCDGGATFLAIAEQIEPAHLTLIVTHGLFTKGFGALSKKFHSIITTNSYRHGFESSIVKVVDTKL